MWSCFPLLQVFVWLIPLDSIDRSYRMTLVNWPFYFQSCAGSFRSGPVGFATAFTVGNPDVVSRRIGSAIPFT